MSDRPSFDRRAMNRPGCNRSGFARASIGRTLGSALICAAAAVPLAASALPVIPQVSGFGTDTPAGRGGKVYKVTNLNPSGAGSLKACVDASGPRVCVFEVSGTIRATKDLVITHPNITIAGQTAPSPGILWRGGALWVQASDVLVQHMHFRAGDDPVGPRLDNRDSLKIDTPGETIRNIVIDHCSFSWALDENTQVWMGWDNVTLSNNIIAEGLHDSLNPLGQAGYGLIVGPWEGRISITGNLFANNYSRNPLSRASQMVFVNNVVYGSGNMDVDLQGQGIVTDNTIIGNVFIRGPHSDYGNKPVHIRNTGKRPILSASKVFVSDNEAVEATDNPWSVVDATGGAVPEGLKSALPPAWPAGMTRMPAGDGVTLKQVLRSAGARPADRDPVDARIIRNVKEHTGGIINCVSANGTARCSKNAGGWPAMAENHRALTLPENPNALTASGYTNLEVWLHEMSAKVEGRSPGLPVPPVLSDDR